MNRTFWRSAALVAAMGLLALPGAASAAGKPPSDVRPPTRPPTTEEGLGNNLSVPTHFVPSTAGAPALRIPCPTPAVAPTGPTVLFGGVPYFLQKTDAVWSAVCDTPASASASAGWGSNLTNGRPLRSGRPIRVEMALTSTDVGTGYVVENLTPEQLDRNATYGTAGAPAEMPFMVWTGGATLTIENLDTGVTTLAPVAMAAEINSTGKVVYGFNWGTAGGVTAAVPGTYELTFRVPSASGVTITGVDPGEAGVVSNPDASTITVTIEVVTGGGKKGGR